MDFRLRIEGIADQLAIAECMINPPFAIDLQSTRSEIRNRQECV